MHTVDLLRGRGIPPKTTFVGIVIAAVTALAPLCTTAALLDRYFQNEVSLEIQSRALAVETQEQDSYSEAIRERTALEKRKADAQKTLSEVATFADSHIQWSPIFITLAEHMPEEMIVTSLEGVRKNMAVIVPSQDDPENTVRVTVPKRSLVINVAGKEDEDHDASVMMLRNKLAGSDALAGKLEDVVISHGAGGAAGEGVVSYEVVCVFEQKR
ncbi:MAG: hypothetical protein JXN61_00275 [Sedimentisphaerales bacterium]|nr:hypothetical protein [Sedimentisphaerales bacterium]